MQALGKTVFQYRALDKQKAWMECKMCKPFNLLVRHMAAAVTQMNNKLEFYPGGSKDAKFDDQKPVIFWGKSMNSLFTD